MNLNEKDIKSVADFTKYAKEILKKAHGDNYDDGIAQETVDGLVSKYGEDQGAMIGALTSGLGEELNEGQDDWYGDSKSMRNFVVRQMSSGMLSNVVKVAKYDDLFNKKRNG